MAKKKENSFEKGEHLDIYLCLGNVEFQKKFFEVLNDRNYLGAMGMVLVNKDLDVELRVVLLGSVISFLDGVIVIERRDREHEYVEELQKNEAILQERRDREYEYVEELQKHRERLRELLDNIIGKNAPESMNF